MVTMPRPVDLGPLRPGPAISALGLPPWQRKLCPKRSLYGLPNRTTEKLKHTKNTSQETSIILEFQHRVQGGGVPGIFFDPIGVELHMAYVSLFGLL